LKAKFFVLEEALRDHASEDIEHVVNTAIADTEDYEWWVKQGDVITQYMNSINHDCNAGDVIVTHRYRDYCMGRNQYMLVWNGVEAVQLDSSEYDCGVIPSQFSVPYAYPPDHWSEIDWYLPLLPVSEDFYDSMRRSTDLEAKFIRGEYCTFTAFYGHVDGYKCLIFIKGDEPATLADHYHFVAYSIPDPLEDFFTDDPFMECDHDIYIQG
jgi:hypothetical protein